MRRLPVSVLSALLCTGAPFAGAATISVPGSGGGIGNFIDSQVYGQSFIAPAEEVLTEAQFSARSITGQDELLRIELFGFDQTTDQVTGSALFDTTATLRAVTTFSFDLLTVTTGGWTLEPGESYILSARHDDGVGQGQWELGLGDVYPGGALRVSDTSSFLTGSWSKLPGQDGDDFAFTMSFEDAVPIPLPAGLPLLVAGLSGLALLVRRRRGSAPAR